MRILPDGMLEALRGSAGDVRMQFNIWYGGDLIFPDVQVGPWSMGWDRTRAVMGQSSFTIVDRDGLMLPWGYADPLSVGGGRIQSKFICGGTSIDLGFQRITRSDPAETWYLREIQGNRIWVAGTHLISIQADDLTAEVATSRYLSPETPPDAATVFGEIPRVCAGIMDVLIDQSLTDRNVPASVVYADDRMTTIQQLVDAVGAKYRVTGGGQLQVYNPSTTSIWTLAGGSHDGDLDKAGRSTIYDGLYNGVISTNTLQDGTTIQGIALETGGDLGWDGEHGHVPYFHQANFATDQQSIDRDAQTKLSNLIVSRASTVPFTASIHPGVETGDVVTLMMPQFNGDEQPLSGVLSQITISGSGNVNASMSYLIDVQDVDIQKISALNRKQRYLPKWPTVSTLPSGGGLYPSAKTYPSLTTYPSNVFS